jgi:hypothetical protein
VKLCLVVPPSAAQKPSQKTPKPNFRRSAIQEPVFSVSNANTEAEGGDDGRGHGDCAFFFLGQMSPTQPWQMQKPAIGKIFMTPFRFLVESHQQGRTGISLAHQGLPGQETI